MASLWPLLSRPTSNGVEFILGAAFQDRCAPTQQVATEAIDGEGDSALKRDGNDLVDEDTPGYAYFDRVADLLADESPSDR